MKSQQGPDNGGLCPFVWQLSGIFEVIKWQDPAKVVFGVWSLDFGFVLSALYFVLLRVLL